MLSPVTCLGGGSDVGGTLGLGVLLGVSVAVGVGDTDGEADGVGESLDAGGVGDVATQAVSVTPISNAATERMPRCVTART